MTIDWSPLAFLVEQQTNQIDLGISIIAPDGSTWSHNGDLRLPSASTAKIPIMVAIQQMIEGETLSMGATYALRDADKAAGSGVLQHMQDGLQLTVADLLYLMISISDNTATNRLIEMAGMPRINTVMRELGMSGSVLARHMVGRLAIAGEQENMATANDYAQIVRSIVNNEAANVSSCEAMMSLMTLQQNNRRIGRHVPTGKGYRWGSKNGTNPGITHDVGYVSAPSGTMVASIFVRGVEDEVSGEQIIADAALAAMRATLAINA